MTKYIDENTHTKLLQNLENFGVSGRSGEVYLALLPQKEVGISILERETGLHRQIIYNALHDLEEKGLTKHVIFNGRKRFSAQSPSRLQSLVDEKQKLAESLIENLSSLAKPADGQRLEVFQGRSSFITHEMQMLLDAEEGETLSLIAGNWGRFYTLMEGKMDAYEKLRISRGIQILFIGLESQLHVLRAAKQKRPLFEYRIIPGLNNGLMDTSIWKKSISLNFFGDPVIVFQLQNEQVATSQKAFFDSLWNMGVE